MTGDIKMNQLHRIKKYLLRTFMYLRKLFRHGDEVTFFSDSEKRFFAVALLWLGLYLYTAHAPNERVIVVPQILVITINDDSRVEPYQVFETTKPLKPKPHTGRPKPSHSLSVACRGWRTVDPLRVHSEWGMCCTRPSSSCAPWISSVPSGTQTISETSEFDHGY